MKGTFGFCFLLVILSRITEATPVAVPLGQLDGGEFAAVLPNNQALSWILLGNAVMVIWYLLKSIWEIFKKDKDRTEQKVDELVKAVQEIKAELKTISKLPSEEVIITRLEDRVEYLVFKVVKDLGLNGKKLL